MPKAEEQYFRARLHTLLGADPSAAELDALSEEAVGRLGPGHSISLLIECSAEYVRSSTRSIQDSISAWSALQGRAEKELPPGDNTLMVIRSYYIRHLRFRGAFGDLDTVVDLRAGQCAQLRRHREDHNWISDDWIGMSEADLAVALTDRGRFGSFDPCVRRPDPEKDLRDASELIQAELERRRRAYSSDHPVTWKAFNVFTGVVVALSGTPSADQREHGADGLAMTDQLIRHYASQRRAQAATLMRARLLRAESLVALGDGERAAREARRICALSRTRMGDLDPGRPYLVLARAQAALSTPEALVTAQRGLAERRRHFQETSHKVAEGRHLVVSLGGAAEPAGPSRARTGDGGGPARRRARGRP